MNKRGYYFTLDAFIALVIIFSLILVIKPIRENIDIKSHFQEDTLKALSSLKMGEINNSYAQQLVLADGKNKTVLEGIAELYAKQNEDAGLLLESIIGDLNPGENMGIWMDNQLIYSYNSSPISNAEDIWTSRQIVSGIEKGEEIRGFSSRAFLSHNNYKKYFYFGGYIGDGNISVEVNYSGEITNADLEIAINKDFDIYINDEFSGHYQKSDSDLNPTKYDLSSYLSRFNSGKNIIEISGENLYIAGGFFRIGYETDNPDLSSSKYYFPGVEGLINIYDGFYIPGNLTGIEIFLHYFSNTTLFMTIGNTTIMNQSSETEEEITLSDSELNSKLNYQLLEGKTIPLRLGLEEIQGSLGRGGVADIVFLIDTTGSMGAEISDVYNIVEDFTEILENSSINYRLGLVEFKDYPISNCGSSSDFPYKIHNFSGEEFTSDGEVYRSKVNDLFASGGYDGPESHLRAINESLKMGWRDNALKYNIMLTDNRPHAKDCLEKSWNHWYCDDCLLGNPWYCSYYDLDDCEYSWTDTDKDCNLGPKYASNMTKKMGEEDIIFYYISKNNSYGVCGNRIMAKNMTNVTGGKFYPYTESEGVGEIILDIAGNIVNLTYSNQTAVSFGGLNTKLYPDSYIKFNYDKEELPYGLMITAEKEFDNSNQVTFTIPENSEVLKAEALSYSGPKWTSFVQIYNDSKWQDIFNLTQYGTDYTELGDPYVVNVPKNEIKNGSNQLRIRTGLSPSNFTSGSESNKIIYSLLKQALGYSPILASAKGCDWRIEFYDYTNLTFSVPANYTGSKSCEYSSAKIAYNENDAIDYSVYSLLSNLDVNSDNRIDSKFSEQDLTIDSDEIAGIPYTYGCEIQIRTWR